MISNDYSPQFQLHVSERQLPLDWAAPTRHLWFSESARNGDFPFLQLVIWTLCGKRKSEQRTKTVVPVQFPFNCTLQPRTGSLYTLDGVQWSPLSRLRSLPAACQWTAAAARLSRTHTSLMVLRECSERWFPVFAAGNLDPLWKKKKWTMNKDCRSSSLSIQLYASTTYGISLYIGRSPVITFVTVEIVATLKRETLEEKNYGSKCVERHRRRTQCTSHRRANSALSVAPGLVVLFQRAAALPAVSMQETTQHRCQHTRRGSGDCRLVEPSHQRASVRVQRGAECGSASWQGGRVVGVHTARLIRLYDSDDYVPDDDRSIPGHPLPIPLQVSQDQDQSHSGRGGEVGSHFSYGVRCLRTSAQDWSRGTPSYWIQRRLQQSQQCHWPHPHASSSCGECHPFYRFPKNYPEFDARTAAQNPTPWSAYSKSRAQTESNQHHFHYYKYILHLLRAYSFEGRFPSGPFG